ncbi:hypothetical protein IFM46972_10521 [Aspergillus udagawae]|uniref:Uncharacterized protein n=1 Tax=Aspergillus udagawae TaxID=91492 RepID=A0A8H3SCV0_9EURO|nr:hypothetical protein IFM46972_10521 [Aspergillus udagawae]
MPEYPLVANVAIHLALSVLDLGISAAAGTAAAATGAHVHGNEITAQILRLGALGGLIKSGILNAATLLALVSDNIFVLVLLCFAGSSFGAAVLATSIIALKSLGDVPNELLIAAAAAGAPLTAGTAVVFASGPVSSILAVGWDALSGYTFARVALNHNFYVCEYKSAAAAGAVFGVLVWFMKLPISLYYEARQKQREGRGRHHHWSYSTNDATAMHFW